MTWPKVIHRIQGDNGVLINVASSHDSHTYLVGTTYKVVRQYCRLLSTSQSYVNGLRNIKKNKNNLKQFLNVYCYTEIEINLILISVRVFIGRGERQFQTPMERGCKSIHR